MHSATTAAALSLHLPVRQEWLDPSREEIIEPDLPIVDPHHHLVDRPDGPRLFAGEARRCMADKFAVSVRRLTRL